MLPYTRHSLGYPNKKPFNNCKVLIFSTKTTVRLNTHLDSSSHIKE